MQIGMIGMGGLSTAAGGASPQVPRAAHFAIKSNPDDRSVDAIERFVLGGGRSNAQIETTRAGNRA
jgi:hydroxymethylpyrimidine pyrophosphatase-like HAD family hydrolase